jgi:hypothetical protein
LTSSPGVTVSDSTTKATPVAIANQTASHKTQSTLHAITTHLTTPATKAQPTTSAIKTHPTKSVLTTHPTTHAISPLLVVVMLLYAKVTPVSLRISHQDRIGHSCVLLMFVLKPQVLSFALFY